MMEKYLLEFHCFTYDSNIFKACFILEMVQYFYSQINAIITSTEPHAVHPSYAPHMVNMGWNKP
jgi:hypothetical protein